MIQEETDKELIERHKNVVKMVEERMRRLERMQFGYSRDNAARFIGSLNFAVMQIESKMRDRNLLKD